MKSDDEQAKYVVGGSWQRRVFYAARKTQIWCGDIVVW